MLELIEPGTPYTIRDTDFPLENTDRDVAYHIVQMGRHQARAHLKAHEKAVAAATTDEAKAAVGDDVEYLLDQILVGWEGFVFRGEPAPCTPEMRRRLDRPRMELLIRAATRCRIVTPKTAPEA
jgi:hypothetical protein